MKRILTSIAFVAISISASAQTKDTFTLKTIPHYDEFGNLYTIIQVFDHVPTQQDSICFNEGSKIQMNIWMDSMYKIYNPAPKPRKKSKKN